MPADRYSALVEYTDRYAPPPAPAARLRVAADLNPEPLRWLWPLRIPRGALTLLVGDPGVGKSLLVADLAARLSKSLPWPGTVPPPRGDHRGVVPSPAPCAPRPAPSPFSPSLRPSVPSSRGPSPSPPSLGPSIPRSLGPCSTLLLSPEDSPSATLHPRLVAARADLRRISILDGVHSPSDPQIIEPFAYPLHADVLEEAIRNTPDCALVVLDPIQSILAAAAPASQRRAAGRPRGLARIEQHQRLAIQAAETLPTVLASLAALARRYNVAIVAVTHLVKARTIRVLYRVRGSLAFIAAARSVLLLSADPDQPDLRHLSTLKTVYGPPAPPLSFRIIPAAGPSSAAPAAPRIDWEDPAARHALPPEVLELHTDVWSALTDACAWLTDFLAAGPQPVRDILRESRAAGHSPATLRRAKSLLGVRAIKPARESPWLWSPPTADPSPSDECENGEDAQKNTARN